MKVAGEGREAVLVPEPGAQEVILRIRELRGQGMALAAIAEQLNGDQVPPPRRGRWHATSVQRVLRQQELEE